jgi:hypothetical protein
MRWIAMTAQDGGGSTDSGVLRSALQQGVNCLQVDVLSRFADAVLSPAEHAAAAGHLEACVVCHAEHALLQSFAYGQITKKEWRPVRAIVRELRRREPLLFDAPSASRGAACQLPLSSWCRLALAMAVILLAAGSGHEFSTSTSADLAAHGSGGGGASRSLAVELVAPQGDQAAVPRRLEWRPVMGAVRYRAGLSEVDRHEIWSVETNATAVDLPAPVRALVAPAKTLMWHVTAYDSALAPIGESPPGRFRLEQR